MAENYGSLTGTLDAHDTLEGNLDNHGEMSGEVQFGGVGSKVDDVLVNEESVVENKIAYIDLTPYAEIENVYDKTTIDTALQSKADVTDIPTDLSELQDDASHRTVTDAEKTEWSGKADTSDIPTALSQLTNDDNYVQDESYQHTDNNYTDDEKSKLADIESGAEANVQSDWNESNTSSDAYILNKPTIPSVVANPQNTTATLTSIGIDGTNYAISGGGGGGAVNSVNGMTGDVVLDAEDVGALPDDTPLFSGDYNDLTNKPTIPDDLADLNDDSTHRLVTDTEKTTWNGKSDFSGSYTDLTDKPTLGTASALDVASSGDASTTEVVKGDDSRLSDARTPVSHTHTTSDITDFPTMSDYIQKSNTSGLVKNDGSIDTNSYATTSQIPDISGKADKVSGATNGNLAGLNASGNLTDSTWSADKTTQSATGNPISISNLKSNQLAINPIITFEPIQAGSGTPSPSNVRAISGYDKVEVGSCGKNLFDSDQMLQASGWSKSNGVYSGDLTNLVVKFGSGFNVPKFKENTQYTISYYGWLADISTNRNFRFVFVYTDGTSSQVAYNNYTTKTYITGWSTSGKTVASIGCTYGSGTTMYLQDIQIEEGSSATTYEPYSPITQISESLGQTVYGGSLDVRTGELTNIPKRIDLGDLAWTYYSSGFFYVAISDVSASASPLNSWCEIYPIVTDVQSGAYLFWNGTQLRAYNTGYTDATTFIGAVTGYKLVYPLATPFTIQLTPHEISLLSQYAYVSTNGTTIALDYHNGEMASLADVSQLGETVNKGFEVAKGNIIVIKKLWSGLTFTNNTTLELDASETGYEVIGVVGSQFPSVDRTKMLGFHELYIDDATQKVCLNPYTTQTVSNGYARLDVLYKKL